MVCLSYCVVHSVGITTLHVVCDTVRAVIAVATDEWSVVVLLTEGLENAEHRRPPSHNFVLYPRNLLILVSAAHPLPPVGPHPVFLVSHPCGDIIDVCVVVGVILGGKIRGDVTVSVVTVGGGSLIPTV